VPFASSDACTHARQAQGNNEPIGRFRILPEPAREATNGTCSGTNRLVLTDDDARVIFRSCADSDARSRRHLTDRYTRPVLYGQGDLLGCLATGAEAPLDSTRAFSKLILCPPIPVDAALQLFEVLGNSRGFPSYSGYRPTPDSGQQQASNDNALLHRIQPQGLKRLHPSTSMSIRRETIGDIAVSEVLPTAASTAASGNLYTALLLHNYHAPRAAFSIASSAKGSPTMTR